MPANRWIIVVVFMMGASAHVAAQQESRADRHGDALPTGAVGRLGTMRVCGAADKERPRPNAPYGAVTHLAVARNGRTIATAGDDGWIRLWDVASHKQTKKLRPNAEQYEKWSLRGFARNESTSWFHWLAFSADDSSLIACHEAAMAPRWGSSLQQPGLVTYTSPENVVDSEAAPDGRRIAFRLHGGRVYLIDIAVGKVQMRLRPSDRSDDVRFRPMLFAPNGRWLAVVTCLPHDEFQSRIYDRCTLRQCDLATGRTLPFAETGNCLHAIAYSPDGRTIAALSTVGAMGHRSRAREEPTYLWETATGEFCRILSQPVNPLRCLAFSPNGRWLVTGGSEGFVRILDLATNRVIGHFEGHCDAVMALRFSPDGKTLYSASADATVLLWDTTRLAPKEDTSERSPAQLAEWWTRLADPDAAKAHAALWQLVKEPKQAVAMLARKLKAAALPGVPRVRAWIADLGSDDFETRHRATQDLARIGEMIEQTLNDVLKTRLPLETRRRVESLLRPLHGTPTAEKLRLIRAVQALELIASPEARVVLRALAGGAAEARETREAQESLERLRDPLRCACVGHESSGH